MTKTIDQILGREFYAQSAVDVAKGLLGREIVRRFKDTEVRGIVMEVSAWEGHTKTSSDGMLYAPGTIGVSSKFGNYILDIATEMSGVNSCVTLEAAELDRNGKIKLVRGKGNVTNAFKITPAEFDGKKIYERDTGLYIVGGRIAVHNVLMREKQGVPANCKGYFYIC